MFPYMESFYLWYSSQFNQLGLFACRPDHSCHKLPLLSSYNLNIPFKRLLRYRARETSKSMKMHRNHLSTSLCNNFSS